MEHEDDWAGPGDTEGTAVAVDCAELQRGRDDIPYRPQVAA
jgi:hypothetical protein